MKKDYPFRTGSYNRLYQSLLFLYYESARRVPKQVLENGINGFAQNALASFVVAATAWESYLNFIFFTPWARTYFGDNAFKQLSELGSELTKLSTLEKTRALPLIAFGKTYSKGDVPFQDLAILIKIRNRIVHDWMDQIPANEIEALRSKHLLLEMPQFPSKAWNEEILTLECIRWCINVLNELNEALFEMSPFKTKNTTKIFFHKFTESQARVFLKTGKYPFAV